MISVEFFSGFICGIIFLVGIAFATDSYFKNRGE